MTQHPLISIIIVAYNCQDDFERTLLNSYKQAYNNKEIIVVDGGSIDGTLDKIKQHNNKIDRWISEPDQGPYDAMNKAAAMATGEWLIFMNAADLFYDDKVMKECFSEDMSGYDIVFGDHLYSDNNETVHIKSQDFDKTWSTLKQGNLSRNWQLKVPCHQAIFTKRSLLIKHPYDCRYKIAADHDFMYKMKAQEKHFYYKEQIITIYQAGGISKSNGRQCIREWISIASKYTSKISVLLYYRITLNFYRAKRHLKKIIRSVFQP